MRFDPYIEVEGTRIGPGFAPYIVAEVSANHNGSLERAIETIRAAKEAGAQAVKIQSYTAESMTIDCDNTDFQIRGGLWDGYSLHRLYQWAQTPYEWHETLFAHAKTIGITLFSTPFDESAVELLERLGTPAYKIASFELIDLPLIACVARTRKPVILSTGMATLEEISEAVDTAHENGCRQLALLHCVSSYPTPVGRSNLRRISDLSHRFSIVAGLSDHTLGTTAAIVSIGLGANLIEKHFTLSRADKGPDSDFSLEPLELQTLCRSTREAWEALGECSYSLSSDERASIQYRRSVYVVQDMTAGTVFTSANVRRIRPGFGLPPKYYGEILGRKAKFDLKRGTALSWELID